ncbi:MAG TPA: hypothetical protein VMG08_07980 [Allosphingosinicella sp.]|nr:hypothetical protein [Allosphingosinicella sp.]
MLTMIAAMLMAPTAADGTLTLQGLGGFRAGTPVSALRRLGARRPVPPEEPGGCHFWNIPSRPDVLLMVVDDRLVRVDIRNRRYRTASGARVGMTETEVRRLYGPRLRVEPHPYTGPQGHYLVYRQPGAAHGLIFETDGRRVLSMRAGLWEQVQWIEGCS